MAAQHKSGVYKPMELKNPFERGDATYHDLLRDAVKEKGRWRNVALFSLILFVVNIFIYYHAVSLQRTIPVLVNVMEWGEAQYIGEVREGNAASKVPEAAIQYQVRDFITKLRGISSDGEVMYRDITQCYEMVTRKGETKMTAELRRDDPFSLVGDLKRVAAIETMLKLSTETYQVDWIETTSGKENKRFRMRGLVTVKLLEPSEKKRVKNPLGIYIDDYDFTTIEGGVK
ncbi:conjugal transfer protein TrbF [Spirochaetia bacterium]|nr:conjugal transfer protein TrbF [Spirochaetia bacterium]